MRIILSQVTAYLPARLPLGVAAFEAWAASIMALLGPGFENVPQDDIMFALAGMIMHLGPQTDRVSKRYFVLSLRKIASNQVAGEVMSQSKQRQAERAAKKAEEAKAADTAQTLADTAPPSDASKA